MDRRTFFALTLPGFALCIVGALPVAAHGAPAIRRIGVLCQDDGSWAREFLPVLTKELDALGLKQGRDFVLEVCAAEERNIPVPECAAQLVAARHDLLFTQNTQNTRALQNATRTIPIVTGVGDPVGTGFGASVARPGGNITGVSFGTAESMSKLIELSRRLVPRWTTAVRITDSYGARTNITSFERASQAPGTVTRQVVAESLAEVERLFKAMRARGERVAFVGDTDFGPEGMDAWPRIAALAIRHRIVLFSLYMRWVHSGALLSFSAEFRNVWGRHAAQIALILRGANPATTPFEMPEISEIGVNRATAKALGIRLPGDILTMATEIVG